MTTAWTQHDIAPRRLLFVMLVATLACTAAWAQGIETYSLAHPFGLSSATTTRGFAMGGQVAALADLGSGNPAVAALHTSSNAGLRWSLTEPEFGPDIQSEHVHYVVPIKPNVSGIQISLFTLRADAAPVRLPQNPIADISEDDIAVHYGRRLSQQVTAGIGLSPVSDIDFTLTAPNGVSLMRVNADSDYGARLGITYEYEKGNYAGLVYDYYQETAQATGPAVGGRARRVYHTDLLAIGVSKKLPNDILLAAEYRNGSTNDAALSRSLSGWHIGAEYTPKPHYAFRAGLNDERLTFGIGHEDDNLRIDFAYMNRWNDDIVHNLFGSSDTYGLQAIRRW